MLTPADNVLSGELLCLSSDLSGRRHVGLRLATHVILAPVMYVVLDFDRPRRLIRVDQISLVESESAPREFSGFE